MIFTLQRYLLFFIFYFLCIVSALIAGEPEVRFTIPWSSSDQNGVSVSHLPEGFYGPQAFKIQNDQLIILDNQSRKLKTFRQGELIRQIPVPRGCFDFEQTGDVTVFHDGNRAWISQNGKTSLIHETTNRTTIKSIFTENGQLVIAFYNGNSRIFKTSPAGVMESTGSTSKQGATAYKENHGRARIEWPLDNQTMTLLIDIPEQNLASVQVTGTDAQNNIYIHIETFIEQAPLRIKRELRQYSNAGELLNTIELPVTGYAYVHNDLHVDENSIVYHLFTSEEGIEIFAWDLLKPAGEILTYPASCHRFESIEPIIENSERNPAELAVEPVQNETSVLAQVTPEEALAIGDTYVQLTWECGAENITNGTITDNYGVKVETPSWVVPGSLDKVPYKWGGFETVDQFLSGISNGKYAGDRYTSKPGGTPSAVGVDCSGFVSRCWKLSSHYSTSMMDDGITLPYDSWEQTRPGDAAHIVGHVRLIVEHNPDGTILMVEAAGYNWRVSYRSYSYSALSSYTPRYYINMAGTPGNIPQPQLASVLLDTNLNVSWKVSLSSSVAEFKLTEADDGLEWDQEHTIHRDSTEYHSAISQEDCRFYRLHSISTDVDGTESLPSDAYGAYRGTGTDKVLIVDGFDRTSSTSGSWTHAYHDFAVDFGILLYDMQIPFETASNDAVISGTISLEDYKAVLWILGDESTSDETFSSTEQNLVKAYLENGGNLFVSGSEIGWDLDAKGSTTDQAFFNNYLKADYDVDDAASYTVNGASGTPFEGITVHFDDGSHGIYEEDYPDAFKTSDGSSAALHYANQKLAAVCYSGSFNGSPETGKVFCMGFPFETIYNAVERYNLLSAVMEYFQVNPAALMEDVPLAVNRFMIYGNYPNPFNAETTIRYTVPQSGDVDIRVFNTLGQLVYTDKWHSEPGLSSYTLDAGQWSSGVYFYRLGFNHQSVLNSRMMLLK